MEQVEYLRAREKEIIETELTKQGLHLGDFEQFNKPHRWTLKYKTSGLMYSFVMAESWHYYTVHGTLYTPSIRKQFDNPKKMHLTDALGHFAKWLRENVIAWEKDQELEHAWNNRHNRRIEAEKLGLSYQDEQSFSETELKELEIRLIEFQNQAVKMLNLSEQKIAALEEGISYLIKESKTQTKYNWLSIAMSIVTSIPALVQIDWASSQDLYNLFIDSLKSYTSNLKIR